MGVERVDMLVLGLPVNTWRQHRGALEEGFRKSLVSVGNREITLDKLKVVPQPFVAAAFLANLCSIPEGIENVVVIAPGFGTLDWLLVSDGVINDARCGPAAGLGMSTTLAAVAPDSEPELWEYLSAIPNTGPGVKLRAGALRKLALLGVLSLSDKGFRDHKHFRLKDVPPNEQKNGEAGGDGTTFKQKVVPSENGGDRKNDATNAREKGAEKSGIPSISSTSANHTPFIGEPGLTTLSPPLEGKGTPRKLKLGLGFL